MRCRGIWGYCRWDVGTAGRRHSIPLESEQKIKVSQDNITTQQYYNNDNNDGTSGIGIIGETIQGNTA